MIKAYFWKWGFWIRIFDYGIAVSTDEPIFSERYGYRRVLRIMGIKFEYLPPSKTHRHL